MWDSFIKRINQVTLGISMVFLVLMVLLIFVQIISRALIGSSFSWTEEVARFLMIWVIFLGSSLAFRYGAHISVETIFDRLPLIGKKVVQIFILVVSLSLFFILFLKGIEISDRMMAQKSPALKIPMGYIYLVIPISAVLQTLNLIDVTKNFTKTGKMAREEV